MMKRKWLLLFIFIGVLTAGYAARGPIVSKVFQWYLKGYCRTCLGSRLTYDGVRYDKGRWIFDAPVLTTQKRLENGGYSAQAKLAIIDVSFFFNRLNLDIEIDSPHIDIGTGAEDVKSIFSNPCQTYRLLDVHMNFKVPQGTILVHDFNEEHLVPVPLFFNMDFTCRERKEGSASLWTKKEHETKDHESKDFLAVFSQGETDIAKLILSFSDVDCFPLQQIFKSIWPKIGSALQISRGTLGGKLVFSFPKNAEIYGEGEIVLKNLEMDHFASGLKVELPSLKVDLVSKQDPVNPNSFTTSGRVEAHSGDALIKKGEDPFWEVLDLSCNASFQTGDDLKFTLAGTAESPSSTRQMNLKGYGCSLGEGKTSLCIDLELIGKNHEDETTLHLSVRDLGEHWSFGDLEISGLGREELKLFQHLKLDHASLWQEFEILKGSLDLSAIIYLKGLELSEVKLEQVAANGLEFAFLPWNLSGSILKGAGSLSFDLASEEPLKTLNAGIDISRASLNLEGLNAAKWEFSNISTSLNISQGVIQKSLLRGLIAGLNGEILLDGTSKGPFAELKFQGVADNFAKALPDDLRKAVEQEFGGDTLQIYAEVIKPFSTFEVKGKVIVSENTGKSSGIDFGFALEKPPVGLWHRWPPHPVAAEYFSNAGLEAITKVAPALASPVNSVYSHLIKQKLGAGGVVNIKNGWLKAINMRLEKFLSPFLFSKNQMRLSGLGDFAADFDGQKLIVRYQALEMVVENADFCAEIPRIKEELYKDPLPALFVYDFERQASFNSFPIHNGTYLEKNTGLLFTEVNAKVSMENATAHLSNIKAFCQGLCYEGEIDLDWSMPGDGVFDVAILLNSMNGKVSDLRSFLSHINNDILLLKIPLEGNASLQKPGAVLQFSFVQEGHDFETNFLGKITDGEINGENVDMSVRELNLSFAYDHAGNTLDFSDIQGTLLVGKANHVEEYSISGDKLTFTDYRNSEIEFDLWVGDKVRNIVRLSGSTSSESDIAGEALVAFNFDKTLSHFGNIHPDTFDLKLRSWSQIHTFKLEFEFALKDLLSDLQRFSRTGLFFLSRNLLKELQEVTYAEGDFKGLIEYEKGRSIMHYQIAGAEVKIGTRSFNKFLLSGTKKDSLWSIEQLKLDDMSIACDILKSGSVWNINFFGAKFGNSLMIGLEGKYRDVEEELDARINVLEVNLEDLSKWPSFKSQFQEQLIAGDLRAAGTVFIKFDKTLPSGICIDAKMTGALSQPSFKGLLLQDIENMSFNYQSDAGFSVNDVKTGLITSERQVKARIFLKEACFNFSKQKAFISGLSFDIPAIQLSWLSKYIQEYFPTFSAKVVQSIEKLKENGALQGVIDASISQSDSNFSFRLVDGPYNFMGKEYALHNLKLELTPFSATLSANCRQQYQLLKVEARAYEPGFDFGEIILSDVEINPFWRQKMPLIAHWREGPQSQFYLQKVVGEFRGLKFDLNQMPDSPCSHQGFDLVGKLDIDFNAAASLMGDELKRIVENLKAGSGYSLAGRWNISSDETLPLTDRISFQGEFLGRDFELMGYRLFNLYAQGSYTLKDANIANLVINDRCGTLQIGQMDFIKTKDAWTAISPKIILTEFRPGFLTCLKGTSNPSRKSLLVRHMELNQFQGILGDLSSFKGYGHLTFFNPPKKNLQHPIFAIPVELITRIGLDMAVLTPVRGSIFYELKNGRASITKFKDVYSKGKLSKFNLANNGCNSYVDFDGSLHLQVRMKQYNLIFKLTELFTVTVQGTLKKPVYAIANERIRK